MENREEFVKKCLLMPIVCNKKFEGFSIKN